jgi:hypothetical protein
MGAIFVILGLVFVFLRGVIWSFVGPALLGSTYNDFPAFQQPPAGFLIAGVVFVLVGASLFAVGFMFSQSSSNAQRLQAVGIPGTATVISAQDTGMTINDNPRVNLTLQVAAGGNTYQASTSVTVPRLQVGRLAPGSVLAIKVDPAKPSDMVIDWQAVPGVTTQA